MVFFMTNATRFLTVEEVAAQMRVSKMTVYRLVKIGELPAVRFGRSFRIDAAALEAYISMSTAGSAA